MAVLRCRQRHKGQFNPDDNIYEDMELVNPIFNQTNSNKSEKLQYIEKSLAD